MRFRLVLPLLAFALGGGTASAEPFKEVSRVLRFHCTSCHNSVEAQGDLDLTPAKARDNLVGRDAAGAKAKLVVPHQPEKSYLLAKLLGTHVAAGGTGFIMPIGGRLDDEGIDVIRRWIKAGAKP